MTQTINNLAAHIWSLADLLRGDFRHSQYGRVILPFTLLRRLEGILEESKEAVLAEYERVQRMDLPKAEQEKLLLSETNGLSFFNTSKMDLSKLDESGIKDNLESYVQGFSKDAREIFEYFKFAESIGQLNDANLLYKIVQQIRKTDLSPKAISNHDIGKVFEELIRRFAESSNETAGEHFTPRDIVHLTTSLVFMEDDEGLTQPDIIRTIYDPAAGTGGFLSEGMDYVEKLNPQAMMRTYGQELNLESYAICKANMLIKGQEINDIKLGNTLATDQLFADKFDYMLSNPPFGMHWKNIEQNIKDEHTLKGFNGRFGSGLPRVSDGSLLFLLHLVSKLKDKVDGGGRIALLVNGSPLFNGGAGSGESEIRRYLAESDLLEAIVALPERMFYNTGIQTYILVLTNRKKASRKNKVQVIDARNIGLRMKKSVGSKSNYFDEESIRQILEIFATEENGEFSKIFHTQEFGYRQVKLKVDGNNIEYEKVPLNEDIETHLKNSLEEVYDNYQIDALYVDEKDGRTGKVGYDFLIDDVNIDKGGKQFRVYFEDVGSDGEWSFYLSKTGNRVIFRSDLAGRDLNKGNAYFFKIRKSSEINLDYLVCFFSSERWKEWICAYKPNAAPVYLNKYELLRRDIGFPSITEQSHIVGVMDGIKNWRYKLQSLENDIWSKNSGSYSFDKYKLPVHRELPDRILDIAPFPLANIIHHYQNIPDSDIKGRYELLLKLFECLGIFLSSVLIGYVDGIKGGEFSRNLLSSQKKYLRRAPFGVWRSLLKDSIEAIQKMGHQNEFILASIIDDTLDLFERANNIRNETLGHGSYPTKSAARETLGNVELLYEGFMEKLYDIFDSYALVRPMKCVWDGEVYAYDLEGFKGLGCYPFGLKKIKTMSPMINGELYLVSEQNHDVKIKLFPFIRLMDIEEDSGLEAFYFYSKLMDDTKKDSPNNMKESLYMSHQQIKRQNQVCTDERISNIFT